MPCLSRHVGNALWPGVLDGCLLISSSDQLLAEKCSCQHPLTYFHCACSLNLKRGSLFADASWPKQSWVMDEASMDLFTVTRRAPLLRLDWIYWRSLHRPFTSLILRNSTQLKHLNNMQIQIGQGGGSFWFMKKVDAASSRIVFHEPTADLPPSDPANQHESHSPPHANRPSNLSTKRTLHLVGSVWDQ